MTFKEFQDYCQSFKGVTGEFPFDARTLVYKVMGKMFTLTDIEDFKSISLKCDPIDAHAYREMFKSVTPGYHLNKKHWNSIELTGEVNDSNLKLWIKESYNLVVKGLPRKIRENI